MQIGCHTCKTIFSSAKTNRRKRRFCSLRCYHQSLKNLDQYRNKKCIYCSKPFISIQESKKQITLNCYCSARCRRKHQSELQKTGTQKVCLHCKQEFYCKKCNVTYKFCCRKCGYDYNRGRYNPNHSIARAKLIAEGKVNPKRNFYKQGWYITKQGNQEWFGSSYEEKRMRQLDTAGIKWTKKHGIRIPYVDAIGNTRNYVPDFLVENKFIEEVKPSNLVNSVFDNNILKHAAAEEFCYRNKKYQYRIITEKDIKEIEEKTKRV